MERLFWGLLLLFLLAPAGCGGEPGGLVERARAEARKAAPDAELVQIEFTHFGFATGQGGIPDMTRAGPPKMALFNFYSRASGKGLRVVADINRDPVPAEVEKAMRERGYRDMRIERGAVPYSPFTLPLPHETGDMSRAVAAARKAIEKECAGSDPMTPNCALVQSAELHMHWSGPQDGGGTPVWRVTFGHHPKTLAPVRSAIEGGSYRVHARSDAQPASYNDRDAKPLSEVALKLSRDFDAFWPAVVAEVQKQDPLYAPYAASLITYLRDRRAAGGKAVIAEAHIQFARLTPALLWDDLEAHVGWRSTDQDQAVLFFSRARRRAEPLEARPATMRAADLPRAGAALASLLGRFPDGYAEVSTVWAKGCEDIPTASPDLTMWRCGVYVATKQRSDLVFLWLSRQGNPYWQSGRAPLATEYRALSETAPKDGWSWWTRVKHPAYWEYFLIDAMTATPRQGFCTNPNTGANTVQMRACGR